MIRKPLETKTCPTPHELEAHVRKELYGKRNEEIFVHLKYCAACLRRLAKLKPRVPSAGEIIQGRRPRWWERGALGRLFGRSPTAPGIPRPRRAPRRRRGRRG